MATAAAGTRQRLQAVPEAQFTGPRMREEGGRSAPDAETQRLLALIPTEQLVCMAAGRHSIPLLRPDRAPPKGMRAVPVPKSGGCYQVTEVCTECTTERVATTLPRGVFDVNAVYGYNHPPWWVVTHGGRLAPRDCKWELYRRAGKKFFAQLAKRENQDQDTAGGEL